MSDSIRSLEPLKNNITLMLKSIGAIDNLANNTKVDHDRQIREMKETMSYLDSEIIQIPKLNDEIETMKRIKATKDDLALTNEKVKTECVPLKTFEQLVAKVENITGEEDDHYARNFELI